MGINTHAVDLLQHASAVEKIFSKQLKARVKALEAKPPAAENVERIKRLLELTGLN